MKNWSNEKVDAIITLQMKNYCRYHEVINPLHTEISFQEWDVVIFNRLSEVFSYVWMEEDDVITYLLCYEGEENTIEVGYVGGKEEVVINIYLELLLTFGAVEVEEDDVDFYAFSFLTLFPYDKNDSWDAYIYGDINEE